jgi:hypothetical protein
LYNWIKTQTNPHYYLATAEAIKAAQDTLQIRGKAK